MVWPANRSGAPPGRIDPPRRFETLLSARSYGPVATALALIAGLFACATLAVLFGRPLYADGAFYLLAILAHGDFQHMAWMRTGATFLTQAPLIVALRAGVTDILWLGWIYGAALYLPLVGAYSATTWLTRRDPLLFVANAIVILACFFPTSFIITGEFQALYALFWCSFILLVTGKADRPMGSAVILVLAAAIAASYEVTALLSLLLLLVAGWRMWLTDSRLARCILGLAMLPLLLGVVIGAVGILVPRDPANAGQFLHALLVAHRNFTLRGLLGLLVLASIISLLAFPGRRIVAALLAVACVGLGRELLRLNWGPALGDAYSERAEVVPILLLAVLLAGFDAWWRMRGGRLPTWRFNPWPLLVPGLLVVTLDLRDTLGWRGFLDGFCSALAADPPTREAYPADPRALRYGWLWTYPTLSLLLRQADSSVMIHNPPSNHWEPYDPNGSLPDIARYKRAGGLCRLVGRP